MSKHTLDDITALTVVYRTPDVFKTAHTSLRRHYPTVPLLVVDNSARQLESGLIDGIISGDRHAVCLHQAGNLGHGVGMDVAIRTASTRFCYVFDSDVEMLAHGLMEHFLQLADDPFYAIGRMLMVDEGGIDAPNGREKTIQYIHPSIMFLDRGRYLSGPAFIRHGAPCINAMAHFNHSGLLKEAPSDTIERYAHHHGRMTRKRKGIEGLVIW